MENKCPYGHKFGADIDENLDCNGCHAWAQCSVECCRIEGMPDIISPSLKGRQCKDRNPITNDCKECPDLVNCKSYLGWFSKVPHFILDDYLPKLSGSAIRVFLFLNKTVNFKPLSNHFGRRWATYEQIAEGSGVKFSYVPKAVEQLLGANLIEKKERKYFLDGKFKTTNQFKVTWYKRLSDLIGD